MIRLRRVWRCSRHKASPRADAITSKPLGSVWVFPYSDAGDAPNYFGIIFPNADASAFRFALSVEYCTAFPFRVPTTSLPMRSRPRW